MVNQKQNFMIQHWPHAILHLDADAFFASCEQALNPELKGKPVVTGAERGIVSAASYEAKDMGINRGIPLWEVKKICPEAIILPSDYESYSLISTRIFDIMRQFTPQVEEYSIDEAFADLTGLQRPLHSSYQLIAENMKKIIELELGITVSIGVSVNKQLAKIAANFQKPSGLTIVPGPMIEYLLDKTPLEKVWGFGPSTVSYLQKYKLKTAYDFACQSEFWVKKHLNKSGLEIWQELKGQQVHQVSDAKHEVYKSISKMKTFIPPSNDPKYLTGQLIRNLESACIKARRHNLLANRVIIYLRQQNFQSTGFEIKLNQASNSALLITPLIKKVFSKIFDKDNEYRTTGIVLSHLTNNAEVQISLFANQLKIAKMEKMTSVIDIINNKFGKHTIHQASSLPINPSSRGTREHQSTRWQDVFKRETYRQHLHLPRWSIKAS
ncbi:MAG: DNA polymerase IV [Candidatus Komeilibacteria bacterium]